LFAQSPDLHAEIRSRIEVGSFVIDEEFVTGFTVNGLTSHIQAAVAYRIDNDLIAEACLYL
jgi:hypothetical protein